MMHWTPLPDQTVASAPPEGVWVTVQSWCGCGLYLGARNVRSPGVASFYADHSACLGTPVFSVTWTAPRAPWVRGHP